MGSRPVSGASRRLVRIGGGHDEPLRPLNCVSQHMTLSRRSALLALVLPRLEGAPAPELPDNLLATLRRGHPRLIALDSDIARIRELVRTDERAARHYDRLVAEGAALESAPTVEYKIVGPRLLTQSRLCLDRVYNLALLYRITGEKRYLGRALRELRAAADFPDWNPSHFLDTAEMTHAFAIGYDWLFPALKAAEKGWIRQAIVSKGLDQAIPNSRHTGWKRSRFNWNQVCNGGIGIGALALADEEPVKAANFLRQALESLPLAMGSYAPDGGWAEGPGYWHYATRYNVYFLAALETALGKDFGLSRLPGFDRAGHFRIYFAGPSGRTFNYADARDTLESAAEMFWLARRFGEPVYAWQQHQLLDQRRGADPLNLVWYGAKAKSPEAAGWPLDAVFRGVNVAFLRSAWSGPDAIFLGIKGGDNKANHSQLDLGTFVLDTGTTRWAVDLGPDDYNLPQYFGKLRWTYYRMRSESQNTLLIDGENQDPRAEAPVTAFEAAAGGARVGIDMTRAYPRLTKWLRSAALVDGRRVALIRDEIEAGEPVEALWGMVTDAAVEIEGRSARLGKDGRTLRAQIRSPADARFDVVSTNAPEPQASNAGTKKLVVRLPGKVRKTSIEVTLALAK
ncbi:MAG: heparinase II/III family protein [Acidobacteria bacterium]|nr:heparinase II/III family protein [Acidobacteriota bacterium]